MKTRARKTIQYINRYTYIETWSQKIKISFLGKSEQPTLGGDWRWSHEETLGHGLKSSHVCAEYLLRCFKEVWQEHTSFVKSSVSCVHTVAGIHHLLKDSKYARTLVECAAGEDGSIDVYSYHGEDRTIIDVV